MSKRPRRSLAFTLYALGIAQLVILAAAVSGVGWLLHRASFDEPGAPFDEGPPPMHAPFDEARPLPPHPPHDHPPPGHGPGHGPHGPGMAPLVTFVVAGILIVGLGSLWTARWIVGPVERLSQTARALGAGDLAARTGLARDDELGDLGRAFDDMADRVQQLLVAEKELLANVSHELRTPLARIRVALDIAGEASPDERRATLADITTDLAELDAIIEDVFTATRLALVERKPDAKSEAPGLELHVEEIGPEVIVSRAAERFRARHADRRLDVTCEPDLPIARVDPTLVRRAIDNLLENAHKYSPDPDAPVALRARRADGDAIVFEVEDRGLGIAASDLPHLFTPFFRGERSRARGTGGVGLGLTLTRRIAIAHGGAIDVTSEPGRGTTARLTLPARRNNP